MQRNFRIFRFDPETDSVPSYRDYIIDVKSSDRILDCLNKIRWEQDGTLGFRMSCAHGVCGSDAMKINGRCALACQKLIGDLEPGEILIEPLPSFKVIKDLIVDLTPFFTKVDQIRPFLMASSPPEEERLQSPDDRKKMGEAIRCILCACCTGACPVSNHNESYLGPAALVQAFKRIFDSRDESRIDRLRQIDSQDGAWGCVNHFECTRVCPKEIPVTKYINTLKREIRSE
jgi:succinate dehydrogenase / fumarate reductase, iron-sulfur subunit